LKKSISILLLFLFLFSNSGMAISLHWCGGKISSIHLFKGGKHSCKCGKKAMKPNCCKDKLVKLKVTKDLTKFNPLVLKNSFSFYCLICSHYYFYYVGFSKVLLKLPVTSPPPINTKAPIYLLLGTFLI